MPHFHNFRSTPKYNTEMDESGADRFVFNEPEAQGDVSPMDALLVINETSRAGGSSGEGFVIANGGGLGFQDAQGSDSFVIANGGGLGFGAPVDDFLF